MLRHGFRMGGSSLWSVSLGIALGVACNVYNDSLLTGPSGGKGGSTTGGEGGEGDGPSGGTSGSTGGAQGGGTSGQGGASGSSGVGAMGGTDTGGQGGTAGDTGGSATGGEAGAGATGGDAGSGTGGKGGAAGDGGNGAMSGSGGAGGNGGNGGMCGKCGCGMPETDTDADTVPDCIDMCMGYRDADCAAIENGLAHRYGFGGTGTVVTDSVGTSHGTAVNATLSGMGTLSLSGGNTSSPPYVNLPNGIVSTLTNATFEVWVTWNQSGTTGESWQRIFDFGTSGTEDTQVSSPSSTMRYLFLTSRAGTSPNALRAAFTTAGNTAETQVDGTMALATGTRQHVALVIDDANDDMALFLNGAPVSNEAFTGQLSDITDVNNWLGRSQYAGDYEFVGVYDEFRIYDVALTEAQLATSFMAGPDPAFLQ